MELTDFMAENHTKVYTGYDHQSNLALLSALLIHWKRIEGDKNAVDNLKSTPNYLINVKDCNSYTLLDKFSELHGRQVGILGSPINDATCALESLSEVPFQVHYSNPKVYGRKRPIVLWETHPCCKSRNR